MTKTELLLSYFETYNPSLSKEELGEVFNLLEGNFVKFLKEKCNTNKVNIGLLFNKNDEWNKFLINNKKSILI
jgi:hypothetical protein